MSITPYPLFGAGRLTRSNREKSLSPSPDMKKFIKDAATAKPYLDSQHLPSPSGKYRPSDVAALIHRILKGHQSRQMEGEKINENIDFTVIPSKNKIKEYVYQALKLRPLRTPSPVNDNEPLASSSTVKQTEITTAKPRVTSTEFKEQIPYWQTIQKLRQEDKKTIYSGPELMKHSFPDKDWHLQKIKSHNENMRSRSKQHLIIPSRKGQPPRSITPVDQFVKTYPQFQK